MKLMISSGGRPAREVNGTFLSAMRKNVNEQQREIARLLYVRVGQGIVRDQCWRIRQRLTPDDTRQRDNSLFTIQVKRYERVSPNIPLHHRGVLMKPSNYRVNLAHAGRAVEVAPPASRITAIMNLDSLGYSFFYLPSNATCQRIVDEAHDSLPADAWFEALDIFGA